MTLTHFNFKIIVTLVLFSASVSCDSSFPNSIPRCKFGDVKCLKNVINDMIKSSSGGIPEIGLNSIDPLYIGKTSLEQGAASSPVNIKVRMKNANMIGIKQFVVTKVVGFEKDPKTSKFEIYGFCPSVSVGATYQMTGKVLIVPVNGNGLANMTFYGNEVKLQIVTHTENRNDEEYLVIDNLLYDATAKKMYMNFDNLFNDPLISQNMNNFFNENQDILYNELKQSMNGIFGNILKKRIQEVFKKFPYSQFFIE